MWLVCGLYVPEILQQEAFYHLPLIEIQPVVFDEEKLVEEACSCDCLLFTSKQAVLLLAQLLNKITQNKLVLCVGPSTAEMVQSIYQGEIVVPTTHDQEGLLELIDHLKPKAIFYPRANNVRPLIKNHLQLRGIKLFDQVIYKTFDKQAELPQDRKILGYFFSSPSSLDSYINQFGLPEKVPILVQGRVTEARAKRLLGADYQVKTLKTDSAQLTT
jgi:uroporphyrinogen-III synthase